jgi:hypothetical protein
MRSCEAIKAGVVEISSPAGDAVIKPRQVPCSEGADCSMFLDGGRSLEHVPSNSKDDSEGRISNSDGSASFEVRGAALAISAWQLCRWNVESVE